MFFQRIDGIARAELGLDSGRADRRTPRHPLGRGEAGGQRRHALRGLQRIAGRDEPPQFVEVERVDGVQARSEEHTSELQSLMRISYAVFCLKKKKTKLQITPHVYKIKITHTLQKILI